jgi:transglutaminase-like putative cysteine protease
MTFGREKRLLLGWMAALAPLPLPFNEVLEFSFVGAYWLAIAVFLYRASQGAEEWLPTWALNVIGLVYLPVVYLDFTRFWAGQILRPLLHLAAFALVVKLFALRHEKDKWHVLIGVFFLFLASMGTSVHPTVLLYLAAFLTLSILVLMRFAALHFLTSFRQPSAALDEAPTWKFLGISTLVTLVVGGLLFPLLPRVGSPYIVAGGPGAGRRTQSSGFSNVMSLDGIGRIRMNNAVALRLDYESPPPMRHELRYKGATYDLFLGNSWRQSPLRPGSIDRGRYDFFHLRDEPPVSWVGIWQEPLGLRNLFLPQETVAVDSDSRRLTIDEGGAVFAMHRPDDVMRYRVALGSRASSIAEAPETDSVALDQSGVSDRLREYAAGIMGEGELVERIERLERHLLEEYEYTMDLLGRNSAEPIEAFLFEDRRGHCELFASSMVLMLRSQGVPARLVTGFLGGEESPLEDYLIVRQSNAHAWVEAYLPDHGWRAFEPTPPSGRPTAGSSTLWRTLYQAYDYLIFRWDRYVLTFGAADQVSLFSRLQEAWSGLRSLIFGEPGDELRPEPDRDGGLDLRPGAARGDRDLGWLRHWWMVVLIAASVLAAWAWWRRPPFDATRAYRLLRRRARRRGLDLPDSVPPEAVAERLKSVWPDAAAAVDPIVSRYLEESFGGRALEASEALALRDSLRRAEVAMKKAA